jgi:glycosyltransferase involved in cell wall biosynthesis
VTRVFINGRFLGQRITGVQRFARELLRHMDAVLREQPALRNRLDLTVLTPRGIPHFAQLEAIRVRETGRLQGQFWEQLELPRRAGNHLLLNLCNTAPLAGRNMVATVHDASVFAVPEAYSRAFGTWYRMLIPALGRRSRKLITVSEFSRRELERYAGFRSDAVAVVPGSGGHILDTSADDRIIRRLGLRPRGYILGVNSHSIHKNVAGFAIAARLRQRVDYDVVLAGAGNSRIFRETPGLEDTQIRITGYVSDAELRALYESAGCFVYPSLYEGFGLPPLEAMTCGCPVIVSRAASLPEVCGDAALYCDPQDPADIARTIDQLLSDTAAQEHFQRRSLEHTRRFSWTRAAGTMLQTIGELVQ